MLFSAKTVLPSIDECIFRDQVLEIASQRSTIFTTPSSYLLSDSLAAALIKRERPIMWLRLGPEDHDPATFLLSLISASHRLNPNIGKVVLDHMKHKPGPVYGWSVIFGLLANELRDALPTDTAIVLENLHFLDITQPTLRLLITKILSKIHESNTYVLVTNKNIPNSWLQEKATLRDISYLRLDIRTAQTIAKHSNIDISLESIRKIVGLARGRAVALTSIYKACDLIGYRLTQEIISRSGSMDELLDLTALSCLDAVNQSTLQAVSLITYLNYSHPEMNKRILGNDSIPYGPWRQSLQDDWSYLHPIWRAPLKSALRSKHGLNYDNLLSVADHLIEQGSQDEAINIYLNLDCYNRAADNINKIVQSMINIGQWKTLDDWLNKLPEPVLNQYPWLIYIRAEIAVSDGAFEKAFDAFSKATQLFSYKNEKVGACLSLLAECAMAARQGDYDLAWSKAIAAAVKAEEAGIAILHGWALWQLGCLATRNGEMEAALNYFDQATKIAVDANDSLLFECVERVETLAARLHELQIQRLIKNQEFLAIQKAESELTASLGHIIDEPQESLAKVWEKYGWLQTPLMIKWGRKMPTDLPSVPTSTTKFWEKVVSVLGLNRLSVFAEDDQANESDKFRQLPPIGYSDIKASSRLIQSNAEPTVAKDLSISRVRHVLGRQNRSPHETRFLEDQFNHLQHRDVGKNSELNLTIYLLGTFRVFLNDKPINNLPVGKGRSIFKYIIFNHHHHILRDVLMDVFWPNTNPESARNNLNVALYSVREALRSSTDVPIIIYEHGAYGVNPDIEVWTDVEEFDNQLKYATKHETQGQMDIAREKLEVVANLYQGDFLADDPYEEWAILTRERLRVSYLNVLDRLSRIYYQNGQYTACAALCQFILERDNCSEDAHCLLMRSYARQNQYHLALRQYQVCIETLREELDIDPAPETIQLSERIRRREHTKPLRSV